MKFGLCIPSHREVMSVDDTMQVAPRAEKLGYDSVWVNDHVIIPLDHLDRFAARYYDPYMVLAHVSALTKRVKLGTSVIVLPYRHPIVQAKMLTTLDALSGGRVIFGVGVGVIEPEYRALGVPFTDRGARADEALQIMLELWTKEEPSFRGRYYAFSDVAFAPKPIQSPHIPIWVGGSSQSSLRRAAQFGDAWHPNIVGVKSLREQMTIFGQKWRDFGRIGEPRVTLRMGCRLYRHSLDGDRALGTGSADQVLEDLYTYRAEGIDYMVLDFAVRVTEEEWNYSFETFASHVMPELV